MSKNMSRNKVDFALLCMNYFFPNHEYMQCKSSGVTKFWTKVYPNIELYKI